MLSFYLPFVLNPLTGYVLLGVLGSEIKLVECKISESEDVAKDSFTLNGQLEACADRSSVSTASHFLVSEKLPNCQGMGPGPA